MLSGAPTIAAKPRRCDDRGAAEWMNEMHAKSMEINENEIKINENQKKTIEN